MMAEKQPLKRRCMPCKTMVRGPYSHFHLKTCLSSQWVNLTKYLSNGDAERLKSHLVVLDNH